MQVPTTATATGKATDEMNKETEIKKQTNNRKYFYRISAYMKVANSQF